jgi:hypothetical protein
VADTPIRGIRIREGCAGASDATDVGFGFTLGDAPLWGAAKTFGGVGGEGFWENTAVVTLTRPATRRRVPTSTERCR